MLYAFRQLYNNLVVGGTSTKEMIAGFSKRIQKGIVGDQSEVTRDMERWMAPIYQPCGD